MHMLARAADAGLAMSYQGVAMISESGVDGSVSMVSKVWHRGGGLTLIQTSSAPSRPAAKTAASTETDASSPGGVFGVTKTLVALLGKHYVARLLRARVRRPPAGSGRRALPLRRIACRPVLA